MRSQTSPSRLLFAVVILLLCFSTQVGAATSRPGDLPRVSIEQVQKMLDAGETVLFVDVRTNLQWQHAAQKIPGAIRLENSSDILDLVRNTPADTAIVTYCT